jgi:hypothetical protein
LFEHFDDDRDRWGMHARMSPPYGWPDVQEGAAMHRFATGIRRRLAGTISLALMLGLLAPGAASASGNPETFGPFYDTYDVIGFECDGFDVRIQGTGYSTFTFWFDENGDVDHVLQRSRSPRDTATNTVTGKSIVVRAAFEERVEYDVATDTWQKTITGFRYLVNEPGSGVTIRDVGRIQYGDLEQTIVLWEAGEHELALDEQFQPMFCEALA